MPMANLDSACARRGGRAAPSSGLAAVRLLLLAAAAASAPVVHGHGHYAAIASSSAAALFFCSGRAVGLLHRSAGGDDGEAGDADPSSDGDDSKQPVDMRTVAMNRARDELAAASQAKDEAAMMAESFYAGQQQIVARMAADEADIAADADAPAIPESKAAVEQTRRYAIQAQLHADHAKVMLKEFENVPKEAAQSALQAVKTMIKKEAYQAAQAAASNAQSEADANYKKRVLQRTAAAMEPYHLALLRAQRRLVEEEAKARSAAGTSNRLQTEAVKLANRANELQTAGLPVQAIQTMTLAHQTAEEGVNLRGWAEKLFAQAQQLQQTIPALNSQIAQAANNAAGTVGVEVVPAMPSPPPGSDAAAGGPAAAAAPGPAPAA